MFYDTFMNSKHASCFHLNQPTVSSLAGNENHNNIKQHEGSHVHAHTFVHLFVNQSMALTDLQISSP